MSATVKRPAALHWVSGEIARLEQERHEKYELAVRTNADLEAIDELLSELEQLRREC